MKLDRKYRRKKQVLRRDIAGESFLIPICGTPADMENVFVFNPLAGFIWELLDEDRTLKEIVEKIVAEYDVTIAEAQADATEFIERLLQQNLVEELR